MSQGPPHNCSLLRTKRSRTRGIKQHQLGMDEAADDDDDDNDGDDHLDDDRSAGYEETTTTATAKQRTKLNSWRCVMPDAPKVSRSLERRCVGAAARGSNRP